jgi:hypothetical protein
MFQICVNCNAQAGYLHADDCPRPKFRGEPDPGSPNDISDCHNCGKFFHKTELSYVERAGTPWIYCRTCRELYEVPHA